MLEQSSLHLTAMSPVTPQSFLGIYLHLLLIGYYLSKHVEASACPSGFIQLNATCYYFSQRPATRGTAQDLCSSVGATLASPSTAEEEAILVGYLNSLGGGFNYWIGITQHNALHFEWADGSPLDDSFWGTAVDPHDERTNCIRMDATLGFGWYDKSCGSGYYNFICETPFENAQDGDCSNLFPLGPVQFGDSCYFVWNQASKPETYQDTQTMCSNIGTHMLTLNTEAERLFIVEQVKAQNYTAIWLGLVQPDYGNYKWMDGEDFNYTNYVPSPFYDGSDCFRMNAADGYKWTDDLCTSKNHFICEKEIGVTLEEEIKIRSFIVGRKGNVPIAQNIFSNEFSSNLMRCGSSCISNSSCSTFAYKEKTRECILANPLNQVDSSDDSDVYFLKVNTPEGNSKRIFVSDEQGKKLWTADILKMQFSEIPSFVTYPLKATYDPVKGYAYVAESNYQLNRIRLDGSYQQKMNLTSGAGNRIMDLSLDDRYRRLYVVLSPPDVIVEYDIDYNYASPSDFINTGLGTPKAVHVVSSKGHVYFSHDGTIERIDCDGINRMLIYSGSPLSDVTALTVDSDTEKIFLVDSSVEDIIYMELDGSNVLYFLQAAVTVRGLGYHGGLLYWVDDDSMLRVSSTTQGSTVTTEEGSIFADARAISIN
ncbi:uncharacterized protein LOC129263871 [Lytechinus pictus]|uniref:uncharacterized protein LOC129263871 n=1 Tax=Lytechinus pictus TaxID=7653 RepID=UPI0030B9EB4B